MTILTFAHTQNASRQYRSGFLKVFVERLRRRRELNYLLSQPEYLLKDIGVTRRDIVREASKPFWQA